MRLLGQNVDEDELLEMINEVDEDGNGTIEFDEYMALMGYNMESLDTVDSLCTAFSKFDDYGDGFVPARELRHIMKNVGEKLKEDELDELIKEADPDMHGMVDYRKFAELMMSK